MTAAPLHSAPTDIRPARASETQGLLRAQRAAFAKQAPDYDQRMRALGTLRDLVLDNERRIAVAISSDYAGRSPDETRLLEILPLVDLVRSARASLRSWMKPRGVRPTWFLLPARAYTVHQPLGVIGVIGTWNYPLLLSLGPAIDALAAGNHVMIKLSEVAPATAELLSALIAQAFPSEYVTAVTGGADVSAEFSAQAFDHLVFTGSARVGELVMRAASKHLTPITLELGGKSPTIVHESFPMATALRRILIGKLYTAGQTCIAPDYLLVPRGTEADVERHARAIVAELYPTFLDNPDYTRIINRARYDWLSDSVRDAQSRGARTVVINPAGDECSAENRVFPPTLVFDAPSDSALLRDEIFGPVLPVVTYASLAEAIEYVNDRPRPLALYYFDNDRERIDHVVAATTSGGVTINDVVLHVGQHNLPFGGVGPSGMGQYHGFAGFQRFSKQKGVMVQARRPFTKLFAPPFTTGKRALLGRFLRLVKGWSGRVAD